MSIGIATPLVSRKCNNLGHLAVRMFGPVAVVAVLVLVCSATGAPPEERSFGAFDCGTRSRAQGQADFQAAIATGEIIDPKLRAPGAPPAIGIARRQPTGLSVAAGGTPVVTQNDLFLYEDSAQLLLTNFSFGQLDNLMADATNAVLAEHGDNFDFVAFYLSFAPGAQFGSAFYLGIENNVSSGIGVGLFNDRPFYGVNGNNVEGWVMMWNQVGWAPGDDVTQLVLGQEFEHRFGVFVNGLPGGRSLQGNDGNCGRGAHWNFRVDGQGSGMEMSEWTGSSPATRLGGTINLNTDIIDSVFSYPDLYLMGYISPAELDSLPSELRYMDTNTTCSSPYNGAISTWGSADMEATNGVRIPTSATAQQEFRTAWVVVHLPGQVPTSSQLDRVVDMLNEWSDKWALSTLGRGTIDNTVSVPFSIAFPSGTPDVLPPDQPTTFDVQTTNLNGSPDSASGLLHYSVDGGAYQTAALSFIGGNDYQATLPALSCTSLVDFYVSLTAVDGRSIQNPRAAPTTTRRAVVSAAATVVFEDDFETDKGWTVADDAGLTDGTWARGLPLGGGFRGDPADDFDGSGQCFLTNPGIGNTDVDDGTTTLTSPPIDLSTAPEGVLDYARFFVNDFGNAPGIDLWVVEISNNGVDWVTLESTPVSTGWHEKDFRISDFVSLTSQVQVRFVATDLGDGSVVEAAVDAFRVRSLDCGANVCAACSADSPVAGTSCRNCLGGPSDGLPCFNDFGCPSGSCVNDDTICGFCNGGTNDGLPCNDVSDCPGAGTSCDGSCEVVLCTQAPTVGDDTCYDGETDLGVPCSTNADCTIGACGLKNRYITVTPSAVAARAGTADQSIQITVASMPLDPARVGETWWAGASQSVNNAPNAALTGALLLCETTPSNAEVWPTGNLHLFGTSIVPGASYEVRMCDAAGSNCSDALVVETGKWGDAVALFGGGGSPDFVDIAAVLSKFANEASSPDMSRTDLRGSTDPGFPNTPDGTSDFVDTAAAVDAFSGLAYPFSVGACPN